MRWKGFITLSIICVLLLIIGIFFTDDIIKGSIEKIGSKMWGAKVEVDNVKVGFNPLSLNISGFNIASKKYEFKNLISIEEITLSILVAPIFEKKLVINKTGGSGLKYNSSRETSGFIPSTKKTEELKDEEVKESKWKSKMTTWIQDLKKRTSGKINVADSFKKEDLRSLKIIYNTEKELVELRDSYKNFEDLKVNETIDLIVMKLKALDNIQIKDVKDIKESKKKLEDVRSALKSADRLKKDIDTKAAKVKKSFSIVENQLKNIENARKQDYLDLMKKLQLPSLETGDIAESLFGDLVAARFNKVVDLIKKIRKYIPPKKKKLTEPMKERDKGYNVEFPKENNYPSFYIMEVFIASGDVRRIFMSDFTTTPWIIGKPVVINAVYDNFDLLVEIERSAEKPSEKIKGDFKEFILAGSTGILSIDIMFTGEQVAGDVRWSGRGILPDEWLSYLKLEDPLVTLTVSVSGNEDALKFNIRSNLDDLIAGKLKKELSKKISEAKDKINALLDGEILSKKNNLQDKISSYKAEKINYLNQQKQIIDNKKEEANEKIRQKKQEADKKLKKIAATRLQKEADKLKKLFK